MTTIKVSPSDFAYLYKDCPRCSYLKLAHGIRPPMTMPGVFSKLDSIQKKSATRWAFKGDLAGYKDTGFHRKIASLPLKNANYPGLEIVVSGLPDLLLANGLDILPADLKTTSGDLSEYRSQVTAYAYVLLHPDPGTLVKLREAGITTTGMTVTRGTIFGWNPEEMTAGTIKGAWSRDVFALEDTIGEFFQAVDKLFTLVAGSMPEGDPKCRHCIYEAARARIYTEGGQGPQKSEVLEMLEKTVEELAPKAVPPGKPVTGRYQRA